MSSLRLVSIVTLLVPLMNAILDDDILYDIEWQSTFPSSSNQLGNTFEFISKRKEKYSCILPKVEASLTKSTDEITAKEYEFLLDALHTKQPCLLRFDPYWVYELCHGFSIRQYHETEIAGKKVLSQEYSLGYYHSMNENKMPNINPEKSISMTYKTINNRETPTLPVHYTSGTLCDITSNKPRETTVYYVCDDSIDENIVSIQEVSSCQYEMIVTAPLLCTLKKFNSINQNQHTINCVANEHTPTMPKNLKKLEYNHKETILNNARTLFTIKNADGTTFVVMYESDNEKNSLIDEENNEKDVPDDIDKNFLKSFFSGEECLISEADWWQYEICFGRHIIQFHEDGSERTSIVLGKWIRDKHIESIKEKRFNQNINEQQQYISFYYTSGDICDTTGIERTVEIKLKCTEQKDESDLMVIYLVEPVTCSYILAMESSELCNLTDYVDEHNIPDHEKFIQSFVKQ